MEIRRDLFDASEDELIEEIGLLLNSATFSAKPKSDEERRELAYRWIATQTDKLRGLVCGNQTIRAVASSGFSAELVVAVAALVESLSLGTAGSPLVILLCRQGLENLCKQKWESSS